MAVSFAHLNLENRSRGLAPPPTGFPPPPSRRPQERQLIPRAAPVNYYAPLPPLSDQPFLELRRPAHKDACFVVSALSPAVPARSGSDADSVGTSLLDRYLYQQATHPMAGDLARTPITPATNPVGLWNYPYTPMTPSNPRSVWAFMTQLPGPPPMPPPPPQRRIEPIQRRVDSIEEEPSPGAQSEQTTMTSSSTSTFRQEPRGPAPRPLSDRIILPQDPIHRPSSAQSIDEDDRSLRSGISRRSDTPARHLSESPPVPKGSNRDYHSSADARRSRSRTPPIVDSGPESGSYRRDKDAPQPHIDRLPMGDTDRRSRSRPPGQDKLRTLAKFTRPSSPHGSTSSRSSGGGSPTEQEIYEETLARLTRPPSPRRKRSSRSSSKASERSSTKSSRSVSSSQVSRKSRPPPPLPQRPPCPESPQRSRPPSALDRISVLGTPPQSPPLEQRRKQTPVPIDVQKARDKAAAALEGRRTSASRSQPSSARSSSTFSSRPKPPSPGLARGVALRPLNTRVHSPPPCVHVSVIISPVLTDPMSDLSFGASPVSMPPAGEPLWSPKTPIAMSSYELPFIMDDYSEHPLPALAWAPDPRGTIFEMDPQIQTPVELAPPRGRDFARSLLPPRRPDRVAGEQTVQMKERSRQRSQTRERTRERPSPRERTRERTRARSESPPRSAYPDDSAFKYTLPPLRSRPNSPQIDQHEFEEVTPIACGDDITPIMDISPMVTKPRYLPHSRATNGKEAILASYFRDCAY